jgi:hypothetical protein
MPALRLIAAVSFALAAPLRPALSQTFVHEPRYPAGFDIQAVSDDARYLTLQNGTVWEVEISDRATTGSWQAGDFVAIRRIWAPRDGYEWQLTKSENVDQVAAVKLVGRRRAAQE